MGPMSENQYATFYYPPPHSVPRRRYWPVATLALIALCILTFLLMGQAGGSKNPDVLLNFGASYGPYLHRGDYWRLVMPMFLHIGWFHLAVNMYALYLLGPILEKVYGYGRFSVIYVGAGICGSFLSMALSRNVAAGASGAIFGIAGAMLVTGRLHPEVVPRRWKPAFGKGMVILIVLNLAFGLFMRHTIDNWGHIGGLLGGSVLAWLIPPPVAFDGLTVRSRRFSRQIVLVPIAIVALAVAATAEHYHLAQEVTALIEQGRQLRGQHEDGPAQERFEQAAQLSPNDERPYEEMGSLFLGENQVALAITKYQKALSLSPGSPEAQLGLAVAYEREGRSSKAQQLLEAVIGKNPQTAEGQEGLADLCAEQKLYPEAIDHYMGALRLKPDLAEAHNNLAWLLATSEDPKYRKPAEALEHARRAVELTHWKEASFIDTLAEALYVNGQYPQAVAVQKKALALDPGDRELQAHMAKYRKAAGA
jgi:membrane associated rhomboid family serine protease/Tfp pilus assembly protein PilF